MYHLSGEIVQISTYEESDKTERWLAASKILWFLIWLMLPFSLYRFLNDVYSAFHAVAGFFIFLVVLRLIGPLGFILLDEFLSRILPNFRAAVRTDRSRVYDFRIRDTEGVVVACLLHGSLQGAAPLLGDKISMVAVETRGVYVVKRGWNETTRSRFAPSTPPFKYLFFFALFLFFLLMLYLRGVLDEWLYSWLADLLAEYYYSGD